MGSAYNPGPARLDGCTNELPTSPSDREYRGTAACHRGIRDQPTHHGSVHRRSHGARIRREDLRLPVARHQAAAGIQGPPELVRHGGLPRLLVGESHRLEGSWRDRHADRTWNGPIRTRTRCGRRTASSKTGSTTSIFPRWRRAADSGSAWRSRTSLTDRSSPSPPTSKA